MNYVDSIRTDFVQYRHVSWLFCMPNDLISTIVGGINMTAVSSVNVPLEDDPLSAQIAAVLSKHPVLYYSAQLENSHIAAHRDKNSFLGDPFTDTFNAYNGALFDSVRQIIRYEKSLSTWSAVVADIDSEDVRNTLIMDYVYPVFRFLSDIPNVFKDQLVRACVKLTTISKGDYSFVHIDTTKDEAPRYNWFKELQKSCSDTDLGNQLLAIIDEDLFKHPDAKHFRDLHGHSAHDLTPTLVSGVNQGYSVGDAVSVQAYTPPVDLPNELAIIDRHRLRIQNAYALFGNYATELQRNYKSL